MIHKFLTKYYGYEKPRGAHEAVSLNYYGIQINIESNDPRFLDFISKNYNSYLKDKTNNLEVCNIIIKHSNNAGSNINTNSNKLEKIGDDIYLSDNYLEDQDTNLRIDYENKTFFISSRRILRYSNIGFIKYIPFLKKRRDRSYFHLSRKLITFSLFAYLKTFREATFIHASAININGKALIFAGHSQVGKTTQATAMLDENNHLITENNLIIIDKLIYPFHELIRIKPGVSDQPLFMDHEYSFGGRELKSIEAKYLAHTPVSLENCSLYIVTLGDKFCIREIGQAIANEIITTNNAYLQEFGEKTLFAFIPHLTSREKLKNDNKFDQQVKFETTFSVCFNKNASPICNISKLIR